MIPFCIIKLNSINIRNNFSVHVFNVDSFYISFNMFTVIIMIILQSVKY